MVVGIFTSWEVDFFDKPENVFKRNLAANQTYPFVTISKGLYVLRVKTPRWAIGLLFSAITIIATTLAYVTSEKVDEYIIFPCVVLFGCLAMSMYHVRQRTFVLDTIRKMYEFYRGDKLIYRGHVHNLYIQLKGQKSGGGETYYQVVLNGYLVDEEPISGATTKKEIMARLGRRLAAKLDINYFDEYDKSRDHVIRHRCPYEGQQSLMSNVADV